ncbi:class I SAM-dependent methyltransferase (plasmid) [Mycolicibacterium psychrotolerans]|uniref:class I SAM-dependent methyltransferase n=1 Tax=Mycolicibacterium psychrotolerans TaxID=216929 RepID=UPI003D664AAB
MAEHYRRLLAPNYTWMLGGDIESTAAAQRALLDELLPLADGTLRSNAVDLGCGSGAQSLALADLGYACVLAVDTDRTLLDELVFHAAGRSAIQVREADAVTAVSELASGSVDVAVCMGDTLPHLPSAMAVAELFVQLARVLRHGGSVILTYRDLTADLRGTDRFLPIRSDDDRIMMCFIDFRDEQVAEVHDIIHNRTAGGWVTTVSSYPKLRLSPAWVRDTITEAGLRAVVHEQGPTSMWRTVARR